MGREQLPGKKAKGENMGMIPRDTQEKETAVTGTNGADSVNCPFTAKECPSQQEVYRSR